MKRAKPIRSIISITVVIFLLTSIVCSSMNSSGVHNDSRASIVLKNPRTPAKSDTQLAEKLESEDDNEPHPNFFGLLQVDFSLQLEKTETPDTRFHNDYRFRGVASGTPLYITIRTIIV